MTTAMDMTSVRMAFDVIICEDMCLLLTQPPPLGSFHDAPKDLVKEIEQLEQLFTVDTAKLKEITDQFERELTKGMFHKYA